MDEFLTDAIPLDTDLVSNYPELVKLGEHLFEEVAAIARITNPYRSKEALKLILINLYKGYRRGRAIRIVRIVHGPKGYKLVPMHARLTVHAAHTLCLFVIETWETRKNKK
jgi:hypothetical protein